MHGLRTHSLYATQEECKARSLLSTKDEMSKVYGHEFDFERAWTRISKAYTPPMPPHSPSSSIASISASRRATAVPRSSSTDRSKSITNKSIRSQTTNQKPSAYFDVFKQQPGAFRLLEERMRDWRYRYTDLGAIKNTLRYMFFRHRKGIYVSLRDGKIKEYFAFVNPRFQNPLAPALRLDSTSESKAKLIDKSLDNTRPPGFWNTTGCLVTGVFSHKTPPEEQPPSPAYEPDHGYLTCLHFLTHLCNTSRVADCDFFLNAYDQLLIRKDMRVPFRHIVDDAGGTHEMLENESEETKISSFKGCRMCPIVSFCTAEGYLDLPFVFPDDIIRVFKMYDIPKCVNPYVNNAVFAEHADADDEFQTVSKSRRALNVALTTTVEQYELYWDKKAPTAVFRGAATGCGWTARDNPRVRLANIARALGQKKTQNVAPNSPTSARSTTKSNASYEPPLLDVELTGKEDARFKKNRWSSHVAFLTPDETGAAQRPELSLDNREQSRFKYLVYVEGNVAAYRLCNMFSMGSVVIYVASEYIPWIYPLMKDRENCVIASSVDDVPRIVQWCRENDEQCSRIAQEGMRMARSATGLRGMKTYALHLFRMLSESATTKRASSSSKPSFPISPTRRQNINKRKKKKGFVRK
jgi:hypothetical protein